MPDITDVVDTIHPADEAIGVPTGTEVSVLFDREIDEATITNGGLFVVGPDTDTWSGPDQVNWIRPEGHILRGSEDVPLESPGYQGIVQGTFRYERIDLVTTTGVATVDTTGDGTLYRTKAIFVPNIPLFADTEYTVYLTGDESSTDTIDTGAKPRTVFDTVQTGGGSDEVTFVGTHTGLASDVLNVEIVNSGVKRTATFNWWIASAPLDIRGPVLTDKKVFLKDGVFAEFGAGTFVTSGLYTSVVKTQLPFENTMFWTFDTGSGSLVAAPDDVSTSVIGNLVPVTGTTAATTFTLDDTTPVDKASNLPLTTAQVVLEFNSAVDSSTVTSETVLLTGKPVNGDTSLFSSREIFKDITVTGTKIILDF